ncbi:MAG: hypothetical protein ACFCU1_12245 [Sumerlaeia bacterium]
MRKILLVVLALSLCGCTTNRLPPEFTAVYARRFTPQQFTTLGYRIYENKNGAQRMRCVGAVSEVDDTGRYGLVWAEYGQDNRGNWHRTGHKDEPFAFAMDLAEAQEIAQKHLSILP